MPQQVVLDPVGGAPKAWVAVARKRPAEPPRKHICAFCNAEVESPGLLVDHIHRHCPKTAEMRGEFVALAYKLAEPLSKSMLAKVTAEWSSWEECHGGVTVVRTYMEIGLSDIVEHPPVLDAIVTWMRDKRPDLHTSDSVLDKMSEEFHEYDQTVYSVDPAIKIMDDFGCTCASLAHALMVAYLLLRVDCDAAVFATHGPLDLALTSAGCRFYSQQFFDRKAARDEDARKQREKVSDPEGRADKRKRKNHGKVSALFTDSDI